MTGMGGGGDTTEKEEVSYKISKTEGVFPGRHPEQGHTTVYKDSPQQQTRLQKLKKKCGRENCTRTAINIIISSFIIPSPLYYDVVYRCALR